MLTYQTAIIKRQRTDDDDKPETNGDAADKEDPVQKFADLVDWGNVPKPAGW